MEADPGDRRLRVYLTNALTGWKPAGGTDSRRHRLARQGCCRAGRSENGPQPAHCQGCTCSQVVLGANPRAKLETVRGDVVDDAAARQLLGCDFIFLAADTMLARNVVNQIACQYLVPTLQLGSKVVVDRKTGNVLDVFGVVRSLGTHAGYLQCNGLVDMSRLAEEAVATVEQRRNQRYVDEPGVEAPSVITLNAMTVGWAVKDFMHFATGLGRPDRGFRVLRSRPVTPGHPQLVVQEPHIDPDCHVCGVGARSVLSVGDAAELPTRVRPKRT